VACRRRAPTRGCANGVFFATWRPDVFAALLRQLASKDVIEQTSQGDLILGLVGEDLRKDKGFYAAFKTDDALAVMYDGQRIGSVDSAPTINEHMILAGRRWKVIDVDERQEVVYVVPASGSKSAPFGGGKGVLHPRIVEEMRTVLASSGDCAFLNPAAAQLLKDARETAAAVNLCTARLIPLEAKKTALMAWAGTRTLDTLLAMFKASGIEAAAERIAIVVPKPMDACAALLADMIQTPPNESKLLESLTGPPTAKYDSFFSPQLMQETRKRRWLNLAPAMAILKV